MRHADASGDFPDARTLPALWEAARWFLRHLTGLCGTPCALVAEALLSRRERRRILHWLRPLEAIVRRLLVVEAARIAETLPPVKEGACRTRKTGKRPAQPPAGPVPFPDLDNSSSWSVRFSLSGPRERVVPVPRFSPRLRVLDTDDPARIFAPAALKRAIEEHRERMRSTEEIPAPRIPQRKRRPAAGNPWRFARRIEAVRRVLENPEAYARRLARRLRKDAERLAEACRPPPPRPPSKWPQPGETCLYYASRFALEALEAFDTG